MKILVEVFDENNEVISSKYFKVIDGKVPVSIIELTQNVVDDNIEQEQEEEF